jgi:hypothetical protein
MSSPSRPSPSRARFECGAVPFPPTAVAEGRVGGDKFLYL